MTFEQIKNYALSIGYSKVGVAPVESLQGFEDEIFSRGMEFDMFAKMLTRPIEKKVPDAKSIIVLVWDCFQYDYPKELQEMIGKFYLSRCFLAPQGYISNARLKLMTDFLQEGGFSLDASPFTLPARWVATRAGVVDIGKNTFAYADGIGSYNLITTIVVDKELEYTAPQAETKCPPNCNLCISSCPTKALYAPFKLDPTKCIAFNNFMTLDKKGFAPGLVPHELRSFLGQKIHGCDICQDVCPRNQKKLKQPKPLDPYIENIAPSITLENIINMSDEFYEQTIKPILYNYIDDKRFFMRNAALAMGNSKDEKYVESLIAALKNSDELISEATTWALEQIGTERAMKALKDFTK